MRQHGTATRTPILNLTIPSQRMEAVKPRPGMLAAIESSQIGASGGQMTCQSPDLGCRGPAYRKWNSGSASYKQ